jgi:hypothetical protein
MMIDQELLDDIESDAVTFDLGLASTTQGLLLRLRDNLAVRKMRAHFQRNPGFMGTLLERARSVYDRASPPQYAHPGDLTVCAYLFILGQTPMLAVQTFIDRVSQERPRQFPSASLLAKYIASKTPATTQSWAPSRLPDSRFISLPAGIQTQGMPLQTDPLRSGRSLTVCR